MTTTTAYGTWCNQVDQYSASLENSVNNAFGSDGHDGFDFDAIVAEYHDAINAALPDHVALCGNEFCGPAYEADCRFDGYPTDEMGGLAIKTIVDAIDQGEIIARHGITA
jgi:hypothetical protein